MVQKMKVEFLSNCDEFIEKDGDWKKLIAKKLEKEIILVTLKKLADQAILPTFLYENAVSEVLKS